MILSGVKQGEYITTVIIFPIIFSLLASILIPILMQIKDMERWIYLVAISLTSLVLILLNLLIAFVAKNQTQITVCSLTLVLIASFLPIFSEFAKSVRTVMEYFLLSEQMPNISKNYQISN